MALDLESSVTHSIGKCGICACKSWVAGYILEIHTQLIKSKSIKARPQIALLSYTASYLAAIFCTQDC